MSNKDTGGTAFPSKKRVYRAGYETNEFEPVDGMTLRDYFAAKAMQAVIINSDQGSTSVEEIENWIGSYAYVVADAMLRERKK